MSGKEGATVGTLTAGTAPAGIGAAMLGVVATAGAVPLAIGAGNIASAWKSDTSIVRSEGNIGVIKRNARILEVSKANNSMNRVSVARNATEALSSPINT
jgi:hypothetical protein